MKVRAFNDINLRIDEVGHVHFGQFLRVPNSVRRDIPLEYAPTGLEPVSPKPHAGGDWK